MSESNNHYPDNYNVLSKCDKCSLIEKELINSMRSNIIPFLTEIKLINNLRHR